MIVEFTKMSGAGNDFVVIDNRDGKINDAPGTARKLCDRHNGIGADGLLLLEDSSAASYRMMYYNADGSYGGMCGNGGRCISAFAVEAGIAPQKHDFMALEHVYRTEVAGNRVQLSMKDPRDVRKSVVLPLGKKRLTVFSVDTGSPHIVVEAKKVTRKGLDAVDVAGLGSTIRYHRKFSPAGTNVNFVEINGQNSLKIRTYERGVEAETMACGTGSIAAAVYGVLMEGLSLPVRVMPKSGQELVVDFGLSGGEVINVSLSGPAVTVFRGSVEI